MNQPSLMTQQIRRVNRRLFVQLFVNRLVWCWTAALGLGAVWFLVEPLVFESPQSWLRWTVAGVLLVLGTLLTGLLAALAAPSRVHAALALDEQFDLKERVTTSLLLTPEQLATPAGQALLADVHQRVEKLDIASQFPVRLSWAASLIPLGAMILALVALFYEPARSVAKVDPRDELKMAPTNKAELTEKFNALKKRAKPKRDPADMSEKLKEIESKLEEIANKPRENRDQVRQRMAELQQLEDDVKDRQKQLMDKSRSVQQQLRQLDQQGQKSKEGPANELEKAMAEGNLNKAQQELDKLVEKMKNNELTAKDKEKLKDQLKDMQEKLEKLARNEDKKQELEKLARDGKIDKETLDRELDQLQRDSEKLQDLKDLADQLGQAKDALEKGNGDEAADKMKAAGDKLRDLDLNDKELDDLQDQLERLQEAKKAAGKGDKDGEGEGEGKGPGEKGKDGNGNGQGEKGDGKGDSDQPNDGGVGQGKRGLGKDSPYKSFDAKQRADFNPKGKKILEGFAPGEAFKSRPGPEIAGDVKQAAQEAPEAIEQQRIPKGARDIAKGYFKNLGGQEEKAPVVKPGENK